MTNTAKTREPLAHPIKDLVPPFPSVDWLSRRLNAGVIPGTKLGRTWVMTDDDVRAALDTFKNTKSSAATTSSITPASARRRLAEEL
ncbi:hypothetical protein [Mycolicibacterium komossense]|uniref:DNA-binding protein n=1 Tax=Mycolicibacterium komossense TaxID=1779 RepID=A0ABT3CID2_9MYCO|nr:hypothetical protein [Mycolicibacterium komossense]MCV7229098.1 hypothetical protein [Mycolicibacterium komossense]